MDHATLNELIQITIAYLLGCLFLVVNYSLALERNFKYCDTKYNKLIKVTIIFFSITYVSALYLNFNLVNFVSFNNRIFIFFSLIIACILSFLLNFLLNIYSGKKLYKKSISLANFIVISLVLWYIIFVFFSFINSYKKESLISNKYDSYLVSSYNSFETRWNKYRGIEFLDFDGEFLSVKLNYNNNSIDLLYKVGLGDKKYSTAKKLNVGDKIIFKIYKGRLGMPFYIKQEAKFKKHKYF